MSLIDPSAFSVIPPSEVVVHAVDAVVKLSMGQLVVAGGELVAGEVVENAAGELLGMILDYTDQTVGQHRRLPFPT